MDPQAISASVIGVGADGETTWLIAPGTPTGTDEAAFEGTGPLVTLLLPVPNTHPIAATLIAAPTAVELLYNDVLAGVGEDVKCGVDGQEWDCTVVFSMSGTTSTMVFTTSASPFPVEGGGSISTPAGDGSVGVSTPLPTPTLGPSSTAQTSGGGTSQSAVSPPPANTNTANGTHRTQSSLLATGFVVLVTGFAMSIFA